MSNRSALVLVLAACASPASPASPDGAAPAPDARATGSADAPRPADIDARPDASIVPARLDVACYLGGFLSYDVDPGSGELHARPAFETATLPFQLAYAPSRAFAYAVTDTHHGGALISYAVAADGSLARTAADPIAFTSLPESLAIDPAGRHLYVPDGDALAVFAIDPDTGALAAIDHSPFAVTGAPLDVGIEPLGRYLYASVQFPGGVLGFALDPDTGAPRAIDGAPFAPDAVHGGALAFSADGRFVYSGGGDVSALAIDPDHGTLALVAGSPLHLGAGSDAYATDVAIDPRGDFLFAVHSFPAELHVLRIDAVSGAPTPVTGSPFDAGPSPYSIAVDPEGRFIYVGNDDAAKVSGFAIERPSGRPTAVTHSPFDANCLQPQLVSI